MMLRGSSIGGDAPALRRFTRRLFDTSLVPEPDAVRPMCLHISKCASVAWITNCNSPVSKSAPVNEANDLLISITPYQDLCLPNELTNWLRRGILRYLAFGDAVGSPLLQIGCGNLMLEGLAEQLCFPRNSALTASCNQKHNEGQEHRRVTACIGGASSAGVKLTPRIHVFLLRLHLSSDKLDYFAGVDTREHPNLCRLKESTR